MPHLAIDYSGPVPWIMLSSVILAAVMSGIAMFEELEIFEHRKFTSWWIRLSFILFWFIMYGSYTISTYSSYVYLREEGEHTERYILLTIFAVNIVLTVTWSFLFFRHKKKIWSLILIAIAFSLLIYQSISLAKYDTHILWWVKTIYATEVVFSFMLNICMLRSHK